MKATLALSKGELVSLFKSCGYIGKEAKKIKVGVAGSNDITEGGVVMSGEYCNIIFEWEVTEE